MENTSIFEDLFCIPHEGEYIIYMPLRGVILLGNAQLVNLLHRARRGDKAALKELKLKDNVDKELSMSEQKLKSLAQPRKLPPFAPTDVSLFLTKNCTLRCRYCYADGGSSNKEMPWDMVTDVLREVADNAARSEALKMTVNFHGGDVSAAWPLFVRSREYLGDLAAARGLALKTSAGLNGILDPDQQRWVIKNIGSATVSIDGPADIQDRQRPFADGSPSSPRVLSTLRAFDDAGFSYGLRCTVTGESIARLDEIVSFLCKSCGARAIKVEPMFPRGRAGDGRMSPPDAAAFVENFRKASRAARKAGRELVYSGARLETITTAFCQAAGHSCAVTPDGNITSCYEVMSSEDPLSSIFFYGSYDRDARRLAVDNERRQKLFGLSVLNKPFCAQCFCKWHCAGDCPVKAIHAEKSPSPDLPDRCYINRELTKDQLIQALGI